MLFIFANIQFPASGLQIDLALCYKQNHHQSNLVCQAMNSNSLILPLADSPSDSSEPSYSILSGGKECSLTIPELINTFPSSSVGNLRVEDQTCPCCREPFPQAPINQRSDTADFPIVTTCGHVLGKQCLQAWLPNNSCPICRAPLFSTPFRSSGNLDLEEWREMATRRFLERLRSLRGMARESEMEIERQPDHSRAKEQQ